MRFLIILHIEEALVRFVSSKKLLRILDTSIHILQGKWVDAGNQRTTYTSAVLGLDYIVKHNKNVGIRDIIVDPRFLHSLVVVQTSVTGVYSKVWGWRFIAQANNCHAHKSTNRWHNDVGYIDTKLFIYNVHIFHFTSNRRQLLPYRI